MQFAHQTKNWRRRRCKQKHGHLSIVVWCGVVWKAPRCVRTVTMGPEPTNRLPHHVVSVTDANP